MSDQSPYAILPESINIPRITSTTQEATLNYYGPVDALLATEASKFLAHHTDAVGQELEPKIKAFLETTQKDCSGETEEKKACWLTTRITKPCTAFKIPRWHQDGPMFEYDKGREDVVRSKYALTLLGPSTLMLQPYEQVFKTQHEAEARYYWWRNKEDGPEPSEDEMYDADDLLRELLGNAFKDSPRVQVGHGQIVRFSWGRDDSPVHSEPDLVSDRRLAVSNFIRRQRIKVGNMSFELLPVELAEHLALYCKPQDLSRLTGVNRAFHAIFNPVLYKRNAAATGLPPCYPWASEHDPQYCWTCPVDKAFRSCLHWAVDHDSLSTIKLAVAYGSDVNKINDAADFIPHEEDPDSIPIWGPIKRAQLATPLHLAIFLERPEIVRWLLDNGASTDLWPDTLCNCRKYGRVVTRPSLRHRDATDQTPLHWVKDCKDQDLACAIVEKLAQWGAPLDAEAESQWGDWHGGTVLNMLIGRREFEPALKLLQLGADPTVQQDEGGCLQLLSNCIEGRDREDMSNCPPERKQENIRP
ncbi:hypothetical protein FAGAP_4719 [Fusarium agapanthi]|uniref:F-box domain-containing protein n=1 Tax=Fusarium agapanthi TaxID=1803897 RepID=A0A9P5BI71_9HYPO|nr:hypothetical protein FAGAP_4719 [Fusarium agapanthi]